METFFPWILDTGFLCLLEEHIGITKNRFQECMQSGENTGFSVKDVPAIYFLSSFRINILAFYHECRLLIGYATQSLSILLSTVNSAAV